jgi:hypothetical protein
MSTLQFLVGFGKWLEAWLRPVIPWLSSTTGHVFLFVWGLLWLSAVGLFPSQPKRDERSKVEPQESAETPPNVRTLTYDLVLDDDDIAALRLLADEKKPSYFADEIAATMKVKRQRAQYHMDRLIESATAVQNLAGAYFITPRGRATLVKLGLL